MSEQREQYISAHKMPAAAQAIRDEVVARLSAERSPDLLTPQEHELLDDLARIAGKFLVIIRAESGRSGDGDFAEVVTLIHGLQNMVLAQAAARAYPTKYRLMGGE